MPKWPKEAWSFVSEVVTEFTEDDCMSLAASLAYYTIFSLAPLLVIVIVAAGLFLSPDQATQAVNSQVRDLVGPQGAEQITTMVQHVQSDPEGSLIARIVGSVVALFGATAVMVQLQTAMNRAWDVRPDPEAGGIKNFLGKRLLSFAMILGIAFLLLVSLALSALLSAVADHATDLLPIGAPWWLPQAINLGVSYLVVTALFAAIFKVLPEADIRWRDVGLGAAVTAALFTVGKWGIGVYLGQSNVGSAYGSASSLAVLLVWVYYSSVILLLGAEFTQVYTRRYGGGLRPVKGAVIASRAEKQKVIEEAVDKGEVTAPGTEPTPADPDEQTDHLDPDIDSDDETEERLPHEDTPAYF
ncbi:MAG: YihY/virulence factor BrkB family protein [Myxococcota bacterium]